MSSDENTVNQFKERFSSQLGNRWSELRRLTGDFLVEAKTALDRPQFEILQRWLDQQHRISIAEQNVCMRISSGEISEGIASLISASKLASMPFENIPTSPEQVFHIQSPVVGGPVLRKLCEFTKEERTACIGSHGIIEVGDQLPGKTTVIQTARASSYVIEGGDLVLVVNSLKKRIRLAISKKLALDVAAVLTN